MSCEPEKEEELSEKFFCFTRKWEGKILTPDLSSALVDELRAIFGTTILVSQKRELEQFYFRARVGEVINRHLPSEFSYPPAKYVQPGRCNLAGYPVFYGAESPQIAMGEVNVKENQNFFMSLWRSGDTFPNYAQFVWDENSKSTRLQEHYTHRKSKLIEIEPTETSKSVLWLLNTLTDMFLAKSHTISAALTYEALKDGVNDGVEYLDAKSKTYYNFALSPDFADKLLLDTVFRCEKGPGGKFRYLETGKLQDDEVVWQEYRGSHDLQNRTDLRFTSA